MTTWLTVASSLIAILAFTDSVLTRYVRAKGRRYAAEHDFEIVRRELEVLKETLDRVESDVRNVEREVAVLSAVSRLRQQSVNNDEAITR